jgi:hypothetical protein
LRNGGGRTWPAGSDDSLVDLVGGPKGRRAAAAVGGEAERRERRKRGSGWARAPHLSGCVAPVASAPHMLVWRPWHRRHTSSLAKRLSPRGIVSQYVLGDYKCMCGAVGRGATHAATSDGRTSSAARGPRRLGQWRRQEGSHMGMCGARGRGATQKG